MEIKVSVKNWGRVLIFKKFWGRYLVFKKFGVSGLPWANQFVKFFTDYPEILPPEKFSGTLRREEKILGERCVV